MSGDVKKRAWTPGPKRLKTVFPPFQRSKGVFDLRMGNVERRVSLLSHLLYAQTGGLWRQKSQPAESSGGRFTSPCVNPGGPRASCTALKAPRRPASVQRGEKAAFEATQQCLKTTSADWSDCRQWTFSLIQVAQTTSHPRGSHGCQILISMHVTQNGKCYRCAIEPC